MKSDVTQQEFNLWLAAELGVADEHNHEGRAANYAAIINTMDALIAALIKHRDIQTKCLEFYEDLMTEDQFKKVDAFLDELEGKKGNPE